MILQRLQQTTTVKVTEYQLFLHLSLTRVVTSTVSAQTRFHTMLPEIVERIVPTTSDKSVLQS
ncbi:hypothetical protein GCM10010525_28830 [Glutamicibacter bergerei]|uniref:Uncharacterized protein n=1 Tax=Glutamicibacter ardleyensis TaxID=225894 RepID=A0ABQ2DBD9_9MICC|nr:hypothetical protein GCM10007173_08200 [Glutamicibacter ardleyensis]